MKRPFRKFRRIVFKTLTATVCLAAIGGAGGYVFMYHTRSPAAAKARERFEGFLRSAGDEKSRLLEKVRGEELEDLKARLSEAVEEAEGSDGETSGVRARLEALQERIARYESEYGPEYRERLGELKDRSALALRRLKDRSDSMTEKVETMVQDVRDRARREREDAKKRDGPAAGKPTPSSSYYRTP